MIAKSLMRKTAFLDTNALVRLFGFWDTCQVAKVGMDSVSSWQDLRTALRGRRIPIIDDFKSDDFGDISSGLRCFTSLDRAKTSYDYFSCQVCLSEMHHVILSSKAVEGLIRRRISRSLIDKRPLVVYRAVLKNKDYSLIHEKLDEFFETLRLDHQIDIQILEKTSYGSSTSSILETAEAIWSRVLTETMDAYIFAAAVECEADYIVTADAALRQVSDNLNNPSDEWKYAARALRKKLGKSSTYRFPRGINLRQDLT